ncbi:Uncharacterised protein [Enterobacter hormaechei]|nr:Uncharacterised protein [Enterobacter hormaechei]
MSRMLMRLLYIFFSYIACLFTGSKKEVTYVTEPCKPACV